jgi:hypothetical protein
MFSADALGDSISDDPDHQRPIFLLRNFCGLIVSEERSSGQFQFGFVFSELGKIQYPLRYNSEQSIEPPDESVTFDPKVQFLCISFWVLLKI